MDRYLIADFSDTYGREPVIALMPDGSLVCVMITGGPTEPHNENVVVICRSFDGGVSWTMPEILFSHKHRGVWATEIFTETGTPMMAVHTYDASSPYKELQTFVSYTYDNGKTWSSPVTFPAHGNGHCIRKGIVLSNGEILFATYFIKCCDGFGDYPQFGEPGFWDGVRLASSVLISSDGGKSYSPYGDFSGKIWEPNCVELENGHVLMYMRNSRSSYIEAAESFDYGRTWVHIGATDIYNADAKIAIEKVNGKVLVVSNVCKGSAMEERKALQLRISDDLCKTWRDPIFLNDPEQPFFYPHMVADKENQVLYIAYENGKKHFLQKYSFSELDI